jgi:hypothetical protein
MQFSENKAMLVAGTNTQGTPQDSPRNRLTGTYHENDNRFIQLFMLHQTRYSQESAA